VVGGVSHVQWRKTEEHSVFRVLIVDDEPLARKRIRRMLSTESDMAVVAECADGLSALMAINDLSPDLVFLDVQMPEMDGLEVIRAIGPRHLPALVFVTAYDTYALKAFEAEALDYLLKPFDPLRFQETLQRVRRRLAGKGDDEISEQIRRLANRLGARQRYLQRLVVKAGDRVFLLNAGEVDWLEAAGNYVCVHIGKENHIVRDSLTHLESCLDPDTFARIHRSTVVNLNRIRELRPHWHGDYRIILKSGQVLPLSRRYRESLTQRLGIQGPLT
jgi:two-component system LytT family response regulator